MNNSVKRNIIVIVIILIIICILRGWVKEGFQFWDLDYPSRMYNPTRNMSYDLRGDPVIGPSKYICYPYNPNTIQHPQNLSNPYPQPYYIAHYGYGTRFIPIHSSTGPFNQSTMYPHSSRVHYLRI